MTFLTACFALCFIAVPSQAPPLARREQVVGVGSWMWPRPWMRSVLGLGICARYQPWTGMGTGHGKDNRGCESWAASTQGMSTTVFLHQDILVHLLQDPVSLISATISTRTSLLNLRCRPNPKGKGGESRMTSRLEAKFEKR